MNVTLVMLKEDGRKKDFPLRKGKTVIGRTKECTLRIPLGEISRKHAVMTVEEKWVTLRDLGSSNGTYINNQRISEQRVAAGDQIVIGPVVFTVQINGEPRPIRPEQTQLEPGSSSSFSPLNDTPANDSKMGTTQVRNSFLEAMCLYQGNHEERAVAGPPGTGA